MTDPGDARRTMYRLRRFHVVALAFVLVFSIVLVSLRGVNARGLGLIGVIASLLVFRWWQLRRTPL